VTRDELISEDYLREQELLHAAPRGYGGRGSKWSPVVDELLRKYQCRSMLDYGCGQGSLVRTLSNEFRYKPEVAFREYDPAIPGKSEVPTAPADLVVCTDVLEHIESDKIFAVMQHLSKLTGRLLFAVISLVPTGKTLSDGRQAHILIRSVDWWKYQFDEAGLALAKTVKGRDPKKDHKQFAAVWFPCGR
jgi:2-polyprenyl-3-methyl-5-hydroxy-6-metoxy-1,4-benzoquinol methylase